MNVRFGIGLGIALAGATLTAHAAVTPEVVGTEWRVTVEAGGEETLTSDQVADLKAKYSEGTVTVFKKLGEGTLNGISLNGYAGPIVVAEGVYCITSVACLGNTTGATTVEDGASLMVKGSGIDLSSEHLILCGKGYDDKGVIRLATTGSGLNNVTVGYVTMAGDCLFAADEGIAQGFNLASATRDFDMGGHTLTLNPQANTKFGLSRIVNAGHFVNLRSSFWIVSSAVLNHGPEHTITLGGTGTSSYISFYSNSLQNHYNWKIIYENNNSSVGIYSEWAWTGRSRCRRA